MADEEPWKAWAELASAPWAHRLDVPGARLLAETSGLDQDGEVWAWSEERVWRLEPRLLLLVRATRRAGGPEELVVLAAASGDELARRTFETFGRSPGLIELLGRAGIELGLRPDDVIEGDEIDDWPAEPPPSLRA